MMDLWTLVELGLLVLPVVPLIYVTLDLLDAYAELAMVELYRPKDSVEYLHARHILITQFVRGILLSLIAATGFLAVISVLDRNWLALIYYGMAIVLGVDSVRARRTRKALLRSWNRQFRHEEEQGATDG